MPYWQAALARLARGPAPGQAACPCVRGSDGPGSDTKFTCDCAASDLGLSAYLAPANTIFFSALPLKCVRAYTRHSGSSSGCERANQARVAHELWYWRGRCTVSLRNIQRGRYLEDEGGRCTVLGRLQREGVA